MTDLVKLYNPANAASLTPEQLEGLQKLESAQIKELAVAYPNTTMQRAYLLIVDKTKPAIKQLPTLSSFENLWNLREKNGLRNYVAYAFKGAYKSVLRSPVKPKRTEVLDLSDTELMSLPGFKTATRSEPPQTVNVTRINKSLSEALMDVDLKVMSLPPQAVNKKHLTAKEIEELPIAKPKAKSRSKSKSK